MQQIPDDPRIRDAEMNGYPEGPEIKCPVCGRECEEIWTDMNGEACGCELCMRILDAVDWFEKEMAT